MRRQVAALLASALLAFVSGIATQPTRAAFAHGAGSAIQTGYFPLSHSMQFLPMQVVYPSSSASSYAAANFAYWDGTTGFYPPQRVGVGFGRWPFVYSLISGPPGMFIGATTWNVLWNGSPAAAWAAGYGVVEWTPNGSNTTGAGWSGSTYTPGVEVQVCDQNNQGGTSSCVDVSWPLSINNSDFYFINADTSSPLNGNAGDDTSGCGTISAPCATIGYAAGINGGAAHAPAGSIVILRGANAEYAFPPTASGGSEFTPQNTGPTSFIGMPGDLGSATVDLINASSSTSQLPSASTTSLVVPNSPDIFFGNLVLNGYGGFGGVGPAVAEFRPFDISDHSRITIQGVTWNNAGYGTSAVNNASFCYAAIGSAPGQDASAFLTGDVENGRETGSNPNNTGMILWFAVQNSLVELNTVSSPNNIGDSFFFKTDVGNTTIRSNFAYAGGGGSFAFSSFGNTYYGANNVDVSYNIGIGFLEQYLNAFGPETYGAVASFRNNFITTNGFLVGSPNYNLAAPYTYFNTTAGGGSLFGSFISAPSINTTGGTLSGTVDYAVTSLGVTGESGINTGDEGNSNFAITFTGSTNAVTFYWYGAQPLNNGFKLYRDLTGTGDYTQYITLAANTASYTDTGSSTGWTTTTGPPGTDTAVSSARFIFDSNLQQTPTQSADPSGVTISSGTLSGLGSGSDEFAASGLLNSTTGLQITGTYLCTRGAETGC